jgi:hypothetical protein
LIRSYDPEVFRSCFTDRPDLLEGISPEDWVQNLKNMMYVEGESVGLLTYEYPGLYTGHWFFKVRGREALNLAHRMVNELFTSTPTQCLRGLTPVKNKAARWAARQIGMKSYGILPFPNGDHELFCMTKDEFYE